MMGGPESMLEGQSFATESVSMVGSESGLSLPALLLEFGGLALVVTEMMIS